MYATDRQTDVICQTKASLNAPTYYGWGHNKPVSQSTISHVTSKLEAHKVTELREGQRVGRYLGEISEKYFSVSCLKHCILLSTEKSQKLNAFCRAFSFLRKKYCYVTKADKVEEKGK